jgi:thioredoxin
MAMFESKRPWTDYEQYVRLVTRFGRKTLILCRQWQDLCVKSVGMSVILCSKCGTKNRVEPKTNMRAVCGRCGAELDLAEGGAIDVTDSTIASVIRSAGDKPVLVDCWAEWCGPCRMLAPTIEQISSESGGRWLVAKLDVDQNPRTAQQYRISSIPTLLIFHHANLVDQIVGLRPKQAIVDHLERALLVS